MDLAHEAVESEPAPQRRRLGWTADNALVRAVGRIPLPLGAKLLLGFGLIAVYLVIGYSLGLVALGQSNTRGEQLNRLQQQAAYEQLLLSDATQLKGAIDFLTRFTAVPPAVAQAYGLAITDAAGALCIDAGFAKRPGFCGAATFPNNSGKTLAAIDPPLARRLHSELPGLANLPTYLGSSYPAATIARFDRTAAVLESRFTALAGQTRARANALVAADHSSFGDSRNLLIGVGAGSLALTLALGLLLAWSVVAPLRRTEARLDEIAAGEFAGRLDVPNRDEIGALAVKVNRMSDQLERAYRELETASRHKSDFLATMSHELRTPLNAIIGFSEVLQEQMFGELNERQLAYVDDVLEAGRHLLALINDVLDLAKIEAGRMELELSQVEIPEILRSAVSMHSERASRAGIALGFKTMPEEITVRADERRVRQIVFNLLSNAVKFTPAEGRIDVSAHLENGNVEVAVADTGRGIAADELEAIFEEFEQTSEGKQAEGTGLGLPLSRKLVELHGGRLWAESEPGHGSTFRFTLPLEQSS